MLKICDSEGEVMFELKDEDNSPKKTKKSCKCEDDKECQDCTCEKGKE